MSSAPYASGAVLVTGATGFVGANVVRLLLERGAHVRALVRPGSPRTNVDGLPLELVEGDLRDADAVRRAVRGCRRVFHVAADYRLWAHDPRELYASNVLGTAHVMEACLAEGVERVVHTSTVGTVGLSELPAPVRREDAACARPAHEPLQALEARGRAGGALIRRARPPAGGGEPDRAGRRVGREADPDRTDPRRLRARAGCLPSWTPGSTSCTPATSRRATCSPPEHGRVGERYILGNQNMTLAEILAEAGAIARPARRPACGYPTSPRSRSERSTRRCLDFVTHRPPSVPLEAVRMARRRMFFDPGKAVRELGLPQTPVRRAFEDAMGWFAERGYLAR